MGTHLLMTAAPATPPARGSDGRPVSTYRPRNRAHRPLSGAGRLAPDARPGLYPRSACAPLPAARHGGAPRPRLTGTGTSRPGTAACAPGAAGLALARPG